MIGRARHLRHQLPVLSALGRAAGLSVRQRIAGADGAPPHTPGPELVEVVPPRPGDLLADYRRWCGAPEDRYPGVLPPHLFPQFCFPILGRTLTELPYPVARVLNAGCRLEIHGPLPADAPLQLAARLEAMDDDGRRARIHQRVSIRPSGAREPALVAHVHGLVPLRRGSGGGRERPRVPEAAERIGTRDLGPREGLAFAFLTGDFNPIHWLRPYARAAGFPSTILHGFATLALAYEWLVAARAGGDPNRVTTVDARFTRPLVLPREVGIFVDGSHLAVGDAPGAPAYLTATYETGASP